MYIESKLPNVGQTIFSTMSQLAADYKAINLGQGFPNFDPDKRLVHLVDQAMKEGKNQYPQMSGVFALREVISKKVKQLYGQRYDPESEITITSGATEAIMAAVLAVVRQGDEVIVIEPSYDCYVPAILLAGGIAKIVQMELPTQATKNFYIDWNKVKSAVSHRTRLIIVNSPHNPTGTSFNSTDLDALESITKDTNILIISDEVYEHIIFDKQKHLSLASRTDLYNRTFVISSFGKTTHTTGWKVGYCCAPNYLTKELQKVHQFMVFTVPSPFQHALAIYTADESTYLSISSMYEEKRNSFRNGLGKSRFNVLPSSGTFFLVVDYSAINNKKELEFVYWLAKEFGVVAIPISAFYSEKNSNKNSNLIRFCFAKDDETINQAIEKLVTV